MSTVPGVGAKVAHGAFWTLFFSLANKIVAFGCQIALAWFLLPDDIGLVATATSVAGILSVFMAGQLQRVLIQRQQVFDQLAGQVFWLSVFLNTTVGLLVAASSPFISRAYHEPRLVPLLLVIAAGIPVMAIPVSYGAKLYIELRFRLMSAFTFVEGAIRNLGGVFLAALGCGASSLVIPLFFSAAFAAIAQRKAAGRIHLERPLPRQWKSLFEPVFWLMLNAFFGTTVGYAINLIITAFHPIKVTGLYFWGSSLSSQLVFFLVTNLQGVLFPALSKMGVDSARQRSAFERALSALLLVTVPVCILQIWLARPGITLVFHERWIPSAGVVQWLSLGLITQPLNVVGGAVMLARGEYRKMACVAGFVAVVTLGAAVIGCQMGTEEEIAKWVGISMLFNNSVLGLVAYRILGGCGRGLLHVCRLPAMLAAAAALWAIALTSLLDGMSPLGKVLFLAGGLLVPYAASVKWLFPELVKQFASLALRSSAANATEIG